MRIFVTGGTGLVGNRLIESLLKRGDAVTMLTRRPDVAKQKWGERCTIVSGDPAQAGSWMLAVDHKRSPEVLPDLLAYAESVVAHMPTVLQSLYPAQP